MFYLFIIQTEIMFNPSNSSSCDSLETLDFTHECDGPSYSCKYYDGENVKPEVNIPKIIMQTWKDTHIPHKWRVSPLSIQRKMPGWKYVLMTDKDNRNFVRKHFPDFLPYYDKFPYNIQRVDAIRYMWLYVNGGIYIDLDFKMQHSLEHLFTTNADVYLVSSGNFGSYYTNAFMASKPGCKLWLKMIEAMKEKLPWYYMGRHVEVMNTTGPVMLTHVVRKSKTVYSVLPRKLLTPCSVCNLNCNTTNSYLKPLPGSSWVTYDTKIYTFFMCKWKRVIAFIVFLLFFILLILFIIWMKWV